MSISGTICVDAIADSLRQIAEALQPSVGTANRQLQQQWWHYGGSAIAIYPHSSESICVYFTHLDQVIARYLKLSARI